MRIRSIKPEFWRSKDVTSLDYTTRLLFIGLWSYVDDNGVGWDELASIAGDLFADDLVYGDTRDTLAMVSRGLQSLSDARLIVRYTVDEPTSEHYGRQLLQITGWEKHQKIDRPGVGHRYPVWSGETGDLSTPELPIFATPSRHPRDTPSTGTGEQGNRGTGEQGKEMATRKRVAPTAGTRLPDTFTVTPDMAAWATEHAPGVDATRATEKFIDYWHSQPGAKGRKTDWTATWRNWIRNEQDRATPNRRTPTTTDRMRGWETAAASLQPSLPRIGA